MNFPALSDKNYTKERRLIPINITPNQSVGDIVAHLPRAAEVYKKYKIDFCCGGHRPLSEAIREKNLDQEEIMSKLQEVQESTVDMQDLDIDWKTAPLPELVDYIIDTHHSFLNRELPELSQLTTTILRAHGAKHQELREVHRLFHKLKSALEAHLIDEEEVIFPLVKEWDRDKSVMALSRAVTISKKLEEEHDEAGEIVHQLREITRDYAIPDDVCSTFASTYERLVELESDLFQHIHLENNILHPRLKEELWRVQNQNLH